MTVLQADQRGWQRVIVDGAPATYLEVGTGPVLLFLHGWGLDYKSYRPGLAKIADLGVRVIAPAMPAFGGTPGLPTEEFSLRGYAAWVLAFLDAAGIDKPVTLLGHSFGGGVAIQLAHDAPDRVARLVLVNSIGGSAWAQGSVLRTLADRPLWDWGLHVPADLLPHRQITRVLPILLDGLVPNLVRNPRAVWRVAGLARTADLTDELEELKRRHLPVVIVWGMSDQIIPAEALGSLKQALGQVEVVAVAGNHNWLIADPDGFCEVMTNLLDLSTSSAKTVSLSPSRERREARTKKAS